MNTKYTLKFTDPLAAKIEFSGGKGANLSLLTQSEFPVPPGFVVVAEGYREFMAGAAELLKGIRDLPFDDADAMRAESLKLRAALAELDLPAALAQEVRSQLAEFPADTCFSVRSSSTMEDLAAAAFAGQHETFLNCSGPDQIVRKIKECFLSLWHDRAIAYRHQQGFDHQLAAMAVVVQKMVRCEVAGVGFSVNPVTGNLNEMIVDSNFGLGESVVSGEGAVDHFVLDRKTATVIEANIAQKSSTVRPVAGGTEEVHLTAEEGAKPSLSPEQLAELAALLVRVEQRYRFPQDIEWGFADGKLHLLQSRPVTTIPARWTRDESAERFPNVITPLTWDFVESGFHRSLHYSFKLMGFPPFNGKWFGMHGFYIYGNQNAVELYGRRAPFMVRTLPELVALLPQLREEFRWVQELPVIWSRDLDFYLIKIGEFLAEPLRDKSLRELWQFVLEVNERGARYFLPNIAISITHSTLYRLLHRLLQMAIGPDAANPLFDHLMAFCETKTGAINKELFEMARVVRENPALENVLLGRGGELAWLADFPEFKARFDLFLRNHGHREIDFDAYAPTWLEAPSVVLDNLRLILQTPMDRTPAEKERDLKVRMQQAEFELFQLVPRELRFFFFEILRLARLYTSLDDLEHYQTTRLTIPLRRGLRELGTRLVGRGVLREPMDVFFARQADISEAVEQDTEARWKRFGQDVSAAKQAYLAAKATKPEWNLGENKKEEIFSGDSLSGLPGSPGVAEGVVFQVLSSEDFGKFPKGAVLVARTTNPTWTPLFYSAAAVITESGGPLSHGAVTAREMRIPAVMSVRECLARLTNGTKVRVDGIAGKVYLL